MDQFTCQNCHNAGFYGIENGEDIDICIPFNHVETDMMSPPNKYAHASACPHRARNINGMSQKAKAFFHDNGGFRITTFDAFDKHFPDLSPKVKALVLQAKMKGAA